MKLTARQVATAIVDRMPIRDEEDRELLFEVLVASENAGSTGVGDGIAIPHVRSPVVLPVDHSSVTLCFLDEPVDFDSIDGKPVRTVFAIVTPTIRAHHARLSRLSAVLHDAKFRQAIVDRAPVADIVATARRAEQKFVTDEKSERFDERGGRVVMSLLFAAISILVCSGIFGAFLSR